ncbi:MAG: hypothetical protein R3E79_33135 [Caldilineaceae bacterium]
MSSSTHASKRSEPAPVALAKSTGLAPGRATRTLWQDAFRRLTSDPLVILCALYLLLLLVVALAPDRFAPLSYEEASFSDKLAVPGALAGAEKLAGHRYLLGADRLGRDILSRLIYGTRVSITVALMGAGISFFIGITYGLIAGFSSARVDNVLMRLVDVIYAYPALILIILLQVFLKAWPNRRQRQAVGGNRSSFPLTGVRAGFSLSFWPLALSIGSTWRG